MDPRQNTITWAYLKIRIGFFLDRYAEKKIIDSKNTHTQKEIQTKNMKIHSDDYYYVIYIAALHLIKQ